MFSKKKKDQQPKIYSGAGMNIGRDDQYYISRGPNDSRARYLHPDGVWRRGTMNEKGEFTGWYPSKEAAQKIFDEYC